MRCKTCMIRKQQITRLRALLEHERTLNYLSYGEILERLEALQIAVTLRSTWNDSLRTTKQKGPVCVNPQ